MIAPVNKIIDFSNVDGPHNRLAIFFQSCNYDCLFCHNPETINMCRHCGACIKTCPVGALQMVDGKVVWDKSLCVDCDTCIKTCRNLASPKITYMSVDDVLERIKKVRPYIKGITTSGGECTLQAPFIYELFTEVQKMGLTCLIDSNGSYDFSNDEKLLSVTDGVMLDVKAATDEDHQKLCHYDAKMALKNLEYLLSIDKLYEVRTVIFPNTPDLNERTVRYVSQVVGDKCFYKIIRYRPFGVREEDLDILGHFTTTEEMAATYVDLAKSLGASKAYAL